MDNHPLGPTCLLHNQVFPFADRVSRRLQTVSLYNFQVQELKHGETLMMLLTEMWFHQN